MSSPDVFTRLRQQIDKDVAGERQRKRRKKRRNSENEDGEDKENILPKWKICLVGAAIFSCFAVLYPSVFSPMLSSLMGRNREGNSNTFKHYNPNHDPRLPNPRSHMHPAAAAAAQMRLPQAEATQQSSRGGIFSWMLPLYTVGMVAFLLYTFFKPKKSKKKRKTRAMYLDESSESDEENGTSIIGRRKLNSVQQRLQKTESAMRQILEQLEGLAGHANEAAIDNHSSSNDTQQKLSPQQVKDMERNLQELKILSDLCKEQRAEVEEVISEEEEILDDEELRSLDSEQEDEEELLEDQDTDEKEEELEESEEPIHIEPQTVKQDKNQSIRKRLRREK